MRRNMNFGWKSYISGISLCLVAFLPIMARGASPRAIIHTDQGIPFSPWVRGQCPYRWVKANEYQALWELATGAMGRGVGGGLDADTYDWRDIFSGSWYGAGGGQFTTLEFLQHARAYDAAPMITANMFGGFNQATFQCFTDNPDGLAADWVRYTNIILPNYRQGDEGDMTGEDLRVYNSISDWGGRPKLLAPDEESVARVEHWQIGNEPEVGDIPRHHIDHYLSPTAYRDRYKLMASAMLAVDPTIKIGPCLTKPAGAGATWLSTLAADADATIDFVSYHPYDGGLAHVWGDSAGMATALRNVRPKLLSQSAAARSIMNQAGRSNYELIASEWNPVSWEGTSQMQSSMANAIGIVESCFTFAEDGMRAASFWQEPQSRLGPSGAFTGLVSDMGDVLVTTSAQLGYDYGTCNFRIYVTKKAGDDSKVMIWGLNFDNDNPITVNLGLSPPCKIVSAALKRYGKAGGGTTLTTYTDMTWSQQDVTTGFNTADSLFTIQAAEISVLVLEFSPTTQADFDRDGDVDMDDFGRFQVCLTGPTVPISDPNCLDANLDNDRDVDQYDFSIFKRCMSGANVPADPACAE